VTDIASIAPGLRDHGHQLFAAEAIGEVSFPEGGHDGCRAIEDGSFWFAHRNAILLDVLERYPPGGMVLDVGGGNGHVTRALLDAGHRAALLEPGAAGIANARARGVAPLLHTTLDQAQFRSESVEAIGIFDVVEHVADEGGFLAELGRILRPSGRLYVTVPAFDWLHSHADVHAGHHRRYTPRRLERALTRSGFEIDWLTCFFSFLAPPILLLRSIPDRLRPPSPDRQRQAEAEHAPGAVTRVGVAALGRAERQWLRGNRRLPVGSSILAVARRR
jgi:SAM-dependent methyltransferase